MRSSIRFARAFGALLLSIGTGAASAQVNVLAERYDDARTGANLAETQLTTANVNTATFGRLWSYAVDGLVQAQPLYVAGVAIPAVGTRNVVIVATMNDVVYAFDADSAATLWLRDLRNAPGAPMPVPIVDITGSFNELNIVGAVGIQSTPVIDAASSTLYLLARTKEGANYVQRLHALDVASGAERANSPVVIQGSAPGNGDGGGTITFDPKTANQRASLALANGNVYIAWASHEDIVPWHGWVITYDKTTLARTAVFAPAPDDAVNGDDGDGGIWMGGRAPAVDAAGNVYYMVGNGVWNGVNDFGESFIKLGAPLGGTLSVLSYLTPSDWQALAGGPDMDLGSSGPMLLPGTDRIVGGGKQSFMYLSSTADLGGVVQNDPTPAGPALPQVLAVNPPDPTFTSDHYILAGGPVYWNRANATGPWMYVWADDDYLKAYHYNGSTFDLAPISQSTLASQNFGSGSMTLSANGSTPGSGIVWASLPVASGGHGLAHAMLHALDADNLATEMWNSDQDPADNMGYWPKFSAPTVVDGRVYMASHSGYVSVYGVLPATPYFTLAATVPATPAPDPADSANPGPFAAAHAGGSPVYTISARAGSGFSGSIALDVSGLPPHATAQWSNTNVAPGSSVTLTVHTTSATPPGTYALTITGTSGSLVHDTSAALGVVAARSVGIGFWTNVCTSSGIGASETAGVLPRRYWNSEQFNRRPAPSGPFRTTPAALIDDGGASIGAFASWSADAESANAGVSDTPGNARLMHCYLDPAVGNSATVTVTNLPASALGYLVYVYADGNNGASARAGTYAVSGPGIGAASTQVIDAANASFSGSFVRADNSAGNYAVLPIGNATGFTLSATPEPTGAAPVNGIQIVPERIFASGFE